MLMHHYKGEARNRKNRVKKEAALEKIGQAHELIRTAGLLCAVRLIGDTTLFFASAVQNKVHKAIAQDIARIRHEQEKKHNAKLDAALKAA